MAVTSKPFTDEKTVTPPSWRRRIRLALTRTRRVPPPLPPLPSGTETRGDRLIRSVAVTILLGVAGAAAYVSYHHFYALAISLGERHDMAVLYPAMSDGVIVMASLVMVYCSRRRLPVPVLAWASLGVGGVVTLVANVAHGWSGGTGSRLLSALAPVAFVAAYELLMWLVRSGRKTVSDIPETDHVCRCAETSEEVAQVVPLLPVDRFEAARLTYEESLQPGNKRVGRRALMNRWGLEQREAEEIIAEVEQGRSQPAPSLNGSSANGAGHGRDTT
ncbi:DUF2637 domain-containing protein [Nonomuraea insulae]|uniref:DUF2637 domain-containing protein n=1 Tax=Nonomuraea insulae TaxID=1616787 RepID=A0ABW1D3Y0_9ACTN